MRPGSNIVHSIGITAMLLFAGGFIASRVPVSMASEDREQANIQVSETAERRSTSGLTIEITNLRNDSGKVVVFVFDDGRAFEEGNYERAAAYREIAAVSGELEARFPELDAGPYAVSLFHDENDDDDFNMDGAYPLEGYGTSGATGSYDQPTFDRASSGAARISVRVHYLRY